MLSKFLDPKNDVAFKKIFGTSKNQDILIHFLNDMLVFKEGKPITKVSFLKTVQDPEIAAKKPSIVDIMCADEVGNQYIVEMQVAEGDGFIKRAQYYAAKAYISQLKVAGKYHTLKEIIFLAITNFIMFPEKTEFKSDHVILDKVTNEHDLKDFSFTFLELAKFKKTKDELTSIIDRWSYFFKNAQETSEKDLQQIIGKDLIIQRAYEELNKFSWSEEELLSYEAVIKREMDHQAILDKQYNDGKAEGELEKAKSIAKAMLKESLDLNL
ncbi:MAG: Rpn family recombination-promoting nuclease/putative transposase, partial [Gammaproteobacteria bacterium]